MTENSSREDLERQIRELKAEIESLRNRPEASVERREDRVARKELEAELRKVEERYSRHFANVNDVIYAMDSEFRITEVSPSVERVLGYKPAELIGRPFPELNILAPEYLEQAFGEAARVFGGERIDYTRYEFITRDGSRRWGEVSGSPIYDDGRVVGLISVARDITERKKAEDDLRRSQKMLARTERIAHIGSWEWDIATDRVTWSEELFRIFKLDPELGAPSWKAHAKLYPPDDFAALQDAVEAAVTDGTAYEIELRALREDGSARICLARGFPEKGPDGTIVRLFGFLQDITEIKQVESALKEQTKTLNDILEKAADGICVCHNIPEAPYVRFTHWNPRMTEMTGYTMEEINRHGWYQSLYPDADIQQKAIERMTKMRQGEDIRAEEWIITTRNGEKKNISISSSVIKKEADKIHVLAVMQEITDRKRAEEEFRHIQKAESLRRMAGAIAHHHNNLLASVIGYLDLALGEVKAESRLADNLTQAMTSAQRVSQLTKRMLAYLGQVPGQRETFDLSEACHYYLTDMQADLPENIALKKKLPSSGLPVNANQDQILEIINNLILNCREAIGKQKGSVTIGGKVVNAEDIPDVNRFPIDWQPEAPRYVCLEFADSGPGIASKDIEKIFDPFFSTKFTGRGLGLPVALGNVKNHGGCIAAESRVGHGSVFRVFLPLSDESPLRAEDGKPTDSQPIFGGGTVMLVEDQEETRKVAKAMLERLGFEVITAKDGNQAVDIFRENQGNVQLVISDLTMPGMNGWETISALRAVDPDIPVILASGYDETRALAGKHADAPQSFLPKPYSLKTLKETLSKVLAS